MKYEFYRSQKVNIFSKLWHLMVVWNWCWLKSYCNFATKNSWMIPFLSFSLHCLVLPILLLLTTVLCMVFLVVFPALLGLLLSCCVFWVPCFIMICCVTGWLLCPIFAIAVLSQPVFLVISININTSHDDFQ